MRVAFNVFAVIGAIFAAVLTVGIFISGWERPPMKSVQIGYRGVGMEQISNPRHQGRAENTVPPASEPAPAGGRPAREAYQNVKILGDLTEDQFNRVMAAITEWVAPEQGCAYCHNIENLAEDVPTKIIARRMFQMTKHINQDWTQHVAQTGVTCYTCHRGRPVPAQVWFRQSTGQPPMGGLVGYDGGQNHPAANVNFSSLPLDPFSGSLDSPEQIRVVGNSALPKGPGPSIKKAEHTYALMVHISQALGVNCGFCHNTRAFLAWDQSMPPRAPAWHAIRMVRELNQSYISPLKAVFKKERLGPQGDVPKLNCSTCHRGLPKPLGGVSMLKDYQELNATALQPVAGPAPETVPAERETPPPSARPPGQPQRGQPSPTPR
jgi:photosynthetic reaction center cytochrome c subunit